MPILGQLSDVPDNQCAILRARLLIAGLTMALWGGLVGHANCGDATPTGAGTNSDNLLTNAIRSASQYYVAPFLARPKTAFPEAFDQKQLAAIKWMIYIINKSSVPFRFSLKIDNDVYDIPVPCPANGRRRIGSTADLSNARVMIRLPEGFKPAGPPDLYEQQKIFTWAVDREEVEKVPISAVGANSPATKSKS
jgi:hypothetical protein